MNNYQFYNLISKERFNSLNTKERSTFIAAAIRSLLALEYGCRSLAFVSEASASALASAAAFCIAPSALPSLLEPSRRPARVAACSQRQLELFAQHWFILP